MPMPYLKGLHYRPNPYDLSPREAEFVLARFSVGANEVTVNEEQVINWRYIEEVEIAPAARMSAVSRLFGNWLGYKGQARYHVGIYYGGMEAVLTHLSLSVAQYIVKMIAYYAPNKVLFTGPEGIVPTTDEP